MIGGHKSFQFFPVAMRDRNTSFKRRKGKERGKKPLQQSFNLPECAEASSYPLHSLFKVYSMFSVLVAKEPYSVWCPKGLCSSGAFSTCPVVALLFSIKRSKVKDPPKAIVWLMVAKPLCCACVVCFNIYILYNAFILFFSLHLLHNVALLFWCTSACCFLLLCLKTPPWLITIMCSLPAN